MDCSHRLPSDDFDLLEPQLESVRLGLRKISKDPTGESTPFISPLGGLGADYNVNSSRLECANSGHARRLAERSRAARGRHNWGVHVSTKQGDAPHFNPRRRVRSSRAAPTKLPSWLWIFISMWS